MMRFTLLVVTSVGLLLSFAGCGGESETWEIVVENRADSPCDIAITYGKDGGRRASVDQVLKGKPHSMVAEPYENPLVSVTVTVGNDVQVPKPDLMLTAGKRYSVIVAADGKATVTVSYKRFSLTSGPN
jgi:hypothetical protein